MTKLKKAICLFVCAVISVAFVTGCAIFEQDVDYYNNLVVASVGADIKITKSQLVAAYSSYGYQYVSQMGLTSEKAYEKTLEDLIDREILVELSIQNFSNHLSASAEEIKNLRGKKGVDSLFYAALYENEKAEVRKKVFDAIDQYYKQFQDKVREERKQSVKSPEGAEDPNQKTKTAASDPFKPFEQLVTRKLSNTVFNMNTSSYESKEFLVGKVPDVWSADIDNDAISTDKSVKTEALSRLVGALRQNEKGMKVGTAEKELVKYVPSGEAGYLSDEDRAIIGREINRMIEDYSKTALTQRFQDIFDFGISAPIDRSLYESDDAYLEAVRDAAAQRYSGHVFGCTDPECKGCKDARAYELDERAHDSYRKKVLEQYNRFVKGMDTVSALESKVVESLSDIYWLPESVANNNFTVSHILIQYNEEQKAEFENLKLELSMGGSVTSESYLSRVRALQDSLKAPMRDEKGVEVTDKNGNVTYKSAAEILEDVEKAIGGKSGQEKINIFRDYMYRYNQDPSIMNAEYEYVMGVIKGSDGSIKPNSKMVEPFTKASLELFGYKQVEEPENNKPVLKWKKVNGFEPSAGSMSQLVMTDFGAHIIMYTRTLSDFIYSSVPNSAYVDYSLLYAPLTSYGDYFGSTFNLAGKQVIDAPAKTMFDVLVEKISKPDFETSRRKKIADFKGVRDGGKFVNEIKLFKGNYKDLIK
jgi:hypothetical protein